MFFLLAEWHRSTLGGLACGFYKEAVESEIGLILLSSFFETCLFGCLVHFVHRVHQVHLAIFRLFIAFRGSLDIIFLNYLIEILFT